MSAPSFRFPNNSQRTVIIGRTGSGKTVMGAWLLSRMNFHAQPWIIVDYKGDELLNSIKNVDEVNFRGNPPKKPGLYKIHPKPKTDDDAVNDYLGKIWARGKTGLLFDEGYMVADCDYYNTILTQGRSLRIPCITLTQRPAWISRFTFSESDFFSIFHLNDRDDWLKVKRFLPADVEMKLAPYHSYWYDVSKNNIFMLKPVPTGDKILSTFDSRIKPKTRFF